MARFHDRLMELSGGDLWAWSQQVGIDYGTVKNWFERDGQPRQGTLQKIAAASGVTVGWLLGEELTVPEGVVRIPVMDVEVGAADGGIVPNGETVRAWIDLHEELIPRGRPVGTWHVVRVRGDSMAPTLYPGDLVMVEPSEQVLDGLWVLRWDDGVLVKRVVRVGQKTIRLIADNTAYPSYELPVDEVHLVGRVVGLFRWSV